MQKKSVYRKSAAVIAATVLASAPFAQCRNDLLYASNGERGSFGKTLSASEGRFLIGAPLENHHDISSGAAYVFELRDGGFAEVAQLVPPTGGISHNFGQAVALWGDTALVGSDYDEIDNHTGAGFVFERQGASWTLSQVLVTDDLASGMNLGDSVAMEGDRIVLGAPWFSGRLGAAYVFERREGIWQQVAKLEPTDTEEVFNFGHYVALDDDRIVVSARRSQGPGAAYVFDWDGQEWNETARLVGSDIGIGDGFAHRLDLDGDRVVVTAFFQIDSLPGHIGSAYVFDLMQGTWTETAKLVGTLGGNNRFGTSVDVEGDRIAIGTTDGGTFITSPTYVELFRLGSEGWYSELLVEPTDGYPDQYGSAVALLDGGVAVGSSSDNGANFLTGAVHVYTLPGAAQLDAGAKEVSLSGNDEQEMRVSACGGLADSNYWVLGSLSGTDPGFQFGPAYIPLVPDAYSVSTIVNPGLTLANGVGRLDDEGRAEVRFHLPPQPDPSLIGIRGHHAALILSPSFAPLTATGAIETVIVP